MNAAQVEPRRPISSCTTKVKYVSYSTPSSIILSIIAQPALSSIALHFTKPSPNSTKSETNLTLSPRRTSFKASSRLSTPISMVSLSKGTDFFLSSAVRLWIAFPPTTPRTLFLPILTRLPKTTLGSTPPTDDTFSVPSEFT